MPQPEPPKSCVRVVPLAAINGVGVGVGGGGGGGGGGGTWVRGRAVKSSGVSMCRSPCLCTETLYSVCVLLPLTPLYCKALRAFQG